MKQLAFLGVAILRADTALLVLVMEVINVDALKYDFFIHSDKLMKPTLMFIGGGAGGYGGNGGSGTRGGGGGGAAGRYPAVAPANGGSTPATGSWTIKFSGGPPGTLIKSAPFFSYPPSYSITSNDQYTSIELWALVAAAVADVAKIALDNTSSAPERLVTQVCGRFDLSWCRRGG